MAPKSRSKAKAKVGPNKNIEPSILPVGSTLLEVEAAADKKQPSQRKPRDEKATVTKIINDNFKNMSSEAKYVTDPVERDRLLAISRMLEDNGLALIQWRNACSKG